MAPPFVTGVSPREGTPGTLVTVRGENLGIDARDIESVKIHGFEMVLTVEWISSSKIMVRSGMGTGDGDIIVTTRSGGVGSCSVKFKGDVVSQVGPKQELAVFVDETHTFLTAWDKRRHVVEDFPGDDLLGLSDEFVEKIKMPPTKLAEIFPDHSGDVTASNFSACRYLLENHSKTSFDHLKAGLQHMKCVKSEVSSEPLTFAKTYLGTFMDCQDALITMHNKLTWDENQKSVTLDRLNMLLQAADKDADTLFHAIISRKETADRTRNVLGIINRFKFLFYLPPLMREKIAKGDHDRVINDYTRAKLLFRDTEVAAFQKVYSEVEKEVGAFQETLHKSLLEMPAPVEDKKKIIRHLVDLEYPGNAAWECIVRYHGWLNEEMLKMKDERTARELDEHESGASFSKASRIIIKTPKKSLQTTSNSHHGEPNSNKMTTPQRILFLEEVSNCLMEYFPAFCRLGLAYLDGHLPKKEKEEGHKAQTDLQTKKVQLRQMTSEILQLYCNLTRKAFLPDSLNLTDPQQDRTLGSWTLLRSEIPSAWLPHCVRTVRNAAEKIRSDIPADSDNKNLLEELVFDLRTDAMRTILKQAIDDVSKLEQKENWLLDTSDSTGSRSQIPALFEHCVNDAVNNLNSIVIRVKTGEQDIFNDQGIQQQAVSLFVDIVQAYTWTLERCAFGGVTKSTRDGKSSKAALDDVNDEVDDTIAPSKKIVITLSNCYYTQKKIVPRLMESLDKNGFQETQQLMKSAEESFGGLYSKLFDSYVDIKVSPVIGSMKDRMYNGKFDWSSSKEPTTVRSYVKDSIIEIVEAHSEVYSILPFEIIPEVMVKLVENVAEELNRLMCSVPKFNKNGALQARIDISAFKDIVRNFSSRNTEECISEIFEVIPVTNQQKDEDKLVKILDQSSKHFYFFFLAFKHT